MMRHLKYTAALAAATLLAALPVACTDDPAEPTEPAEPTTQSGDLPIRWNVKSVSSSSDATRMMIGERKDKDGKPITDYDNPDFYVTLKEVCTAPKKDDGTYDREARFAIGLFGDYTYKNDKNEDVTEYDFYRGDRLVYLPDATEEQTPTGWDTNVAMKYWHPGAKYIFRAYYPQRLYNYTISTSSATTLALVYPSSKLQYDLLLAVKELVPTTEEMKNGVDLEFKHALAALRFHFKLDFEDADFLTSVYLCTHNDDDGFGVGEDEKTNFFSQGTAVFGAQIEKDDTDEVIEKKRKRVTWLHDYCPPASDILYKWVPPLKYWYSDEDLTGDGKIKLGGEDLDGDGVIKIGAGKDKDGDGVIEPGEFESDELSADVMLAKWNYGSTVVEKTIGNYRDNPVFMSTNVTATEGGPQRDYKVADSYFGTELYYEITKDQTGKEVKQWVARTPEAYSTHEVDAYRSDEADEVAAEGTLFCRNSGWLLIPPQQSFGALTLCFTTKKGGQTLYKVNLPEKTGTELNENGDVILGEDGKPVTGPTDAEGNYSPSGSPAWVAGYRYTYMVTISESNLKVNVTIKPWNERKHSTEIIF